MTIEELKEAAENGDARAQLSLGYKYDVGETVSQDLALAALWYSKAAEQGLANAQFNLAEMLRDGVGLSKSSEMAFAWYLKAAMQGHAKSQYNLGIMFAKGEGTPVDNNMAYVWFRLAEESGTEGAKKAREIVGNALGSKCEAANNVLAELKSQIKSLTIGILAKQECKNPMVPDSRIFKDIKNLPPLAVNDSKWVVAQMEEGGKPLIVRANCTAKDWVGHPLLSVKVGCAIPFKNPSPNGLPDHLENEHVLRVEDVIVEEFGKRFIGLLAIVLTTGIMRELVFYVRTYDDFDAVKATIQMRVKTHAVQFLVVNEPEWDTYINFAPFT